MDYRNDGGSDSSNLPIRMRCPFQIGRLRWSSVSTSTASTPSANRRW